MLHAETATLITARYWCEAQQYPNKCL